MNNLNAQPGDTVKVTEGEYEGRIAFVVEFVELEDGTVAAELKFPTQTGGPVEETIPTAHLTDRIVM